MNLEKSKGGLEQKRNPFFGKAFRRKIERQDQQELLVFITPTLVQKFQPNHSQAAAKTNVIND